MKNIKFMDFSAGIGGGRIGLENLGMSCLGFSEIDKDAEISSEIDPRYFTPEHMRELKDGGTNRISFGVQDFEPKVQEAVHRVQSFELTSNAVKIARDAGVESFNVDLMYGLPYQSFETFKITLDLTLILGAD